MCHKFCSNQILKQTTFITWRYIIDSEFMAFSFTDAPSLMQARSLALATPSFIESTVRISLANSSPLTDFASSNTRTRHCSIFQIFYKADNHCQCLLVTCSTIKCDCVQENPAQRGNHNNRLIVLFSHYVD